MMNMKVKAKRPQMVTVLITAGAAVTAALAIWSGIEVVDSLVMSEAEAAPIHRAQDDSIEKMNLTIAAESSLSECRYLSDKKDRFEYELYVLRRDGADPDLIQVKQATLDRVDDKYDSLNCVTLL